MISIARDRFRSLGSKLRDWDLTIGRMSQQRLSRSPRKIDGHCSHGVESRASAQGDAGSAALGTAGLDAASGERWRSSTTVCRASEGKRMPGTRKQLSATIARFGVQPAGSAAASAGTRRCHWRPAASPGTLVKRGAEQTLDPEELPPVWPQHAVFRNRMLASCTASLDDQADGSIGVPDSVRRYNRASRPAVLAFFLLFHLRLSLSFCDFVNRLIHSLF